MNSYNAKDFSKRLKSVSSDNFFKYKDFYGVGGEKISESPNKYHPSLKEVYEQKSAGFESELTRKLKSNKLVSPFEWKMDSNTPNRPFRDRFKLGSNKISGKITNANEENAFEAMKVYLQKEKRKKDAFSILYSKPQLNYLKKSMSQGKFDHGDIINGVRNLQKDSKYSKAVMSHAELPSGKEVLSGRTSSINKILPKIKSERSLKADRWRKKKNRVKGQSKEEAFFSTKDIETLKAYERLMGN
uniref:Uncharacterized protein n=1 Tax=Euplotes crassus TaxID=5936 RepID=A0A7S3NVV9_EUPCR|mmetsp:Transcript_22676/g.22519  ORF Transcript_22676/g.22519 Transcript_22676/m.22519 type:complete len:244 (+) Transcript_22676:260-991(+)|eukprot:CAMPEP_0197007420 /NCGR_PEP_ID=MMETSP1380-20130617/40507_1 /TAXON_ID=5936 /ORGANISM="Euplotes crassus, Strain CT5" /LENGTH=243 /DNA_ID=CAMNT_0042427491 /DNA_START=257 /DNA_END=988 /DNA_ORIENTATION=+